MDSSALNSRIITRPATGLDKHFVLSTWLKGQRYGNGYYRAIPDEVYYAEYTKIICSILLRAHMQIVIACGEEDPNWIVGFTVFKEPDLYWIHVKKDYREKGIATLMLKDRILKNVKAITKIGQCIAEKKKLTFNPFTQETS